MPGFTGQGCTPHFLFETSKRKCAVHGGKEKMFGRLNLTHLCQVDRKYGSRRGRCGADLQTRTGCAILLGNRDGVSPHLGVPPCFRGGHRMDQFLFPLPLPFRGGVSKGEGPQPRPFVSFQGGVGETGKTPPVADEVSLFRGSGAIGGPEGAGNRNAATVLKSKSPRADDIHPYGIMEERQH